MNKRMGKIYLLIFTVMAIVLSAAPALAADDYEDLPGQEVRVLLSGSSTATSFTIAIGSGEYTIVSSDDPDEALAEVSSGNVTFTRNGSNGYTVSAGGFACTSSSPFLVIPEAADDYFIFNGMTYRGCFKAIFSGSYFYAINQINVELYLYGVVGREIGYNYNKDAIMAQAVAARSYALANYSPSHVYYDLTATTSSQVYGGRAAESDKIIAAVDTTRGMALRYNGKYVCTYYSSNAGGYSENVENVWVSDAIPIKGVPSPHDAMAGNYSSYGASTYSWVVEYTPEQLVQLANDYGDTDIGAYKSISYSTTYGGQTSVSGRAMIVTITGSKGSVSATKDKVRSLLNLKSSLITITDNTRSKVCAYVKGSDNQAVAWSDLDDLYAICGSGGTMSANGSADSLYVVGADSFVELDKQGGTGSTVVISGRGYGHGVGMSQFGAIGMGDDGYTWDEIIEHYFCTNNGIELVEVY